MPVPDTDTFAMSDVVTEIGAGDDLVELFALSNPDGFDPTYVGDKTNLLNFRNYNNNPTSPWNVSALQLILHHEFPAGFIPDTATALYVKPDGLSVYCGEGGSTQGEWFQFDMNPAFDFYTMTFVGTKVDNITSGFNNFFCFLTW